MTPLHLASPFYDVPSFRRGRSTLGTIERRALGDIRGKSVLHLQCHFGLDTLSLARLGARTTGVDFSSVAITAAKQLSCDTGLSQRASFICCDILDLPAHLDRRFDIVFTSHGVLEWLSSLERWGEVIGHFLRPGGRFLIVEVHPCSLVFDETRAEGFVAVNSYATTGLALRQFNRTDYTSRRYVPKARRTKMLWPMACIMNSLIAGGLAIRGFREYPFTTYRHFPGMRKRADGYWHLPRGSPGLPLMFSLEAVRCRRGSELNPRGFQRPPV